MYRVFFFLVACLFFLLSPVAHAQPHGGELIGVLSRSSTGGLAPAPHLIFGPDGHLYVSNSWADEILRFDKDTGIFMDAFVTNGSGNLQRPLGLTFGPDGNLYVVSSETREILRYDGSTGAFMDVFVPADEYAAEEPIDIEFGPDGKLYVSNHAVQEKPIYRYNGTDGTFIDTFVPPTSRGIAEAEFIAFGPDGDLFVSHRRHVSRLDGTTGAYKSQFAWNDDQVFGMAFNGNYFYLLTRRTISRYPANTTYNANKTVIVNDSDLSPSFFSLTGSPLFDDEGRMYVASFKAQVKLLALMQSQAASSMSGYTEGRARWTGPNTFFSNRTAPYWSLTRVGLDFPNPSFALIPQPTSLLIRWLQSPIRILFIANWAP